MNDRLSDQKGPQKPRQQTHVHTCHTQSLKDIEKGLFLRARKKGAAEKEVRIAGKCVGRD